MQTHLIECRVKGATREGFREEVGQAVDTGRKTGTGMWSRVQLAEAE